MSVQYPSAVDYTLALQHPAAAFNDPTLRSAVFARGLLGPEGIAGSSAVVFRAKIGDEQYAVRCYTRQDASTPDRYAALDAYVVVARLGMYAGEVAWFEDEVLVKGSRWPVLIMGWITGRPLHEYVGYLVDEGDLAALRTLAGQWLKLVNDLQRAQFAHGDLQHGNILVDTDGRLRLVDFDSVWIPPLRGQSPPTETGHPSYQPAVADPATRWGPHMDTFPGLVIYLALTALAKAPELWDKFNNGDNLLFERRDFVPPGETEVWAQLAGLGDAEVDRLAFRLRQFCAPGWVARTTLQEAVELSGAGPRTEPARAPAAGGFPGPDGAKWWEKTGSGPVRSSLAPAGATAYAGPPPAPSFTPAPPSTRPVSPPPAPAPTRPTSPSGVSVPTRLVSPSGVSVPTRLVNPAPAAAPTRPVTPSVYSPEHMTRPVLPPPPVTPYQSRIRPSAGQDAPKPPASGTWWTQPSMPPVRRKPLTSPMLIPREAVHRGSDTLIVPDELRLPRWRQRVRDLFRLRRRPASNGRAGLSAPLFAGFYQIARIPDSRPRSRKD